MCAFVLSTLHPAHPFKGFSTVCQLREHMELLRSHVFGNPHSTNSPSQAMTNLVEHVRTYVLDYFNASPDDYAAIFTANATGVGCLLARKAALAKLRRPWYAGGTITRSDGSGKSGPIRGGGMKATPPDLPPKRHITVLRVGKQNKYICK